MVELLQIIQSNWIVIMGMIILGIASFYIPGLRLIWTIAFKACLSENVLRRFFLIMAEKLVASTKNPLAKEWLEEVKKQLPVKSLLKK